MMESDQSTYNNSRGQKPKRMKYNLDLFYNVSIEPFHYIVVVITNKVIYV